MPEFQTPWLISTGKGVLAVQSTVQILDTFLQTTYLSCQRSGVHDSKVFHLAAMLTMLNATLAR